MGDVPVMTQEAAAEIAVPTRRERSDPLGIACLATIGIVMLAWIAGLVWAAIAFTSQLKNAIAAQTRPAIQASITMPMVARHAMPSGSDLSRRVGTAISAAASCVMTGTSPMPSRSLGALRGCLAETPGAGCDALHRSVCIKP